MSESRAGRAPWREKSASSYAAGCFQPGVLSPHPPSHQRPGTGDPTAGGAGTEGTHKRVSFRRSCTLFPIPIFLMGKEDRQCIVFFFPLFPPHHKMLLLRAWVPPGITYSHPVFMEALTFLRNTAIVCPIGSVSRANLTLLLYTVAKSCPTLLDPTDCSQAPLSFTSSWSLLKFMSIMSWH